MTITERIGEAFEFAEQLTVVGRKLQPGETAPNFVLDYLDPATSAMSTVQLADSAGKVRLLNVINSLDTPLCHLETRRWDTSHADLPPGVVLYTISMDLPFAQARWHVSEGVTHQSLSAHCRKTFGQDYESALNVVRQLTG